MILTEIDHIAIAVRDATVTGDDLPVGKGKPDPEPYLLGAAACGVHPEETSRGHDQTRVTIAVGRRPRHAR